MLDEIPVVRSGELKIDRGSVVICYTDGLTEVENEDLEQYGAHRLSEAVKNNYHAPTAALNQLIIKELNVFRGAMPYVDDTALLSCRFH
jgi:sigma-B regulation protein RsbU (phosphoserine phosphatase)